MIQVFSAAVLALLLVAMLSGCGLFEPDDPVPLTPPEGLTATDGTYTDRVRVSWQSVPRADSYNVYRGASQDGDFEKIAETTATHHDDDEVVPGDVYWYCVCACAPEECSPLADPISGYAQATPGPTNVRASHGTFENRIEVRWDPLDGAERYELEVRDEGGSQVGDLREVDGADTLFSHTYIHQQPMGEPAAERDYTYRVRAIGEETGVTAWSESAVGMRSGRPAPPVLDSLEAVDEGDDGWTVVLTWTWTWQPAESPNPASEFHVYRRLPDQGYASHAVYDGEGEDDYNPGTLPYTQPGDDPIEQSYGFIWEDDDVEEGETYYYTVWAVHEERGLRSNDLHVTVEEE